MATHSSTGTKRSGPAESPDTRAAYLAVEHLTKTFGGLVAIDDLSFTIRKGEILGFVGPNGAGKSTTFNCIMGTLKPTSGTVYFRGEDITGKPTYELVGRGFARTYQDFRPLEDRTVLENIEVAYLPNEIFSTSRLGGESRRKATAITERVGLEEHAERMPDELPHTDILRLEIGRALATDPSLLLLDEPFAGLAYEDVRAISDLIRELRDEGVTISVIDHNMRGLLELVDRVVVINFGSLLAEGTPTEIRSDPEVQRAYLGGTEP